MNYNFLIMTGKYSRNTIVLIATLHSRHYRFTTYSKVDLIGYISRRFLSKEMENEKRPEHLQLTSTQTRQTDIYDAEISCIEKTSQLGFHMKRFHFFPHSLGAKMWHQVSNSLRCIWGAGQILCLNFRAHLFFPLNTMLKM